MRCAIFFLFPLVALALAQCKKSSSQSASSSKKASPSSIVHISSLTAKSIEADSASTCLITAQLNSDSIVTENFIVFNTSLGQFPNGQTTDTAVVDFYGVAVMPLLSDAAGDALISVSVGAVSVDTSISFTPALPDGMLCMANQYTAPDSVDFNMTCNLYRNPGRGKVTDPIKVLFSFSPSTGSNSAPALIVPSFANSVRGVVTDSVLNPYRNTGTFVIQASTLSDNGNSLIESVTLIVN